ncbi:hypothetical protein AG1IA_05079 [Rhizoctonia solani AG-1 IA]|uniref:Uncharacterized protein n=1 Tax=Thanatephorus cucumeris (strain AG1-IA) TaxID=983506 RepID=L8WSD8_THACA|nr:hypothetical protein AG1IA_05079 [Rhizoctonia solani AG-1 IA]
MGKRQTVLSSSRFCACASLCMSIVTYPRPRQHPKKHRYCHVHVAASEVLNASRRVWCHSEIHREPRLVGCVTTTFRAVEVN